MTVFEYVFWFVAGIATLVGGIFLLTGLAGWVIEKW